MKTYELIITLIIGIALSACGADDNSGQPSFNAYEVAPATSFSTDCDQVSRLGICLVNSDSTIAPLRSDLGHNVDTVWLSVQQCMDMQAPAPIIELLPADSFKPGFSGVTFGDSGYISVAGREVDVLPIHRQYLRATQHEFIHYILRSNGLNGPENTYHLYDYFMDCAKYPCITGKPGKRSFI